MESADRGKLSEREQAVLDLAIEGLTDQQIAHRLEIQSSTVNSYWVRIRGKLGQCSRTELVSAALRETARQEMATLRERAAELERQLQGQVLEAEDVANAEMYRTAFRIAPEAMMVLDPNGTILFANEALEALFGHKPGGLVNQPLERLILMRSPSSSGASFLDFFRVSHPVKLGVDRVIYGRRKDGGQFRLMLQVDSRSTSKGLLIVCLVRSFMEELDLLRRQSMAFANSL